MTDGSPGGSRRLSGVPDLTVGRVRSHGYVETSEPKYIPTLIDRGTDILVSSGRIGAEVAAALKAEARRRVQSQEFFGHIAYLSLIGRRPTQSNRG